MLSDKIGTPAMLEQTAEECTELAYACLKLARTMRGNNPSVRSESQMNDKLREGVADVMICIDELFYCELVPEDVVENIMLQKIRRQDDRFKIGGVTNDDK